MEEDHSKLKIKFNGVRGTYPIGQQTHQFFGAATSCVSFSKDDAHVIIDAGTGIISHADYLIENSITDHHIFLTHFHFDHIEGLPFFKPMYRDNHNINIYGHLPNSSIENLFASYINEHTFPMALSDMNGKKIFHDINTPSEFIFGNLKIETFISRKENHPVHGCTYYKVSDMQSGYTVACIWDYEPTDNDDDIIAFCNGADMLIIDTFFTEEEYLNPNYQFKGYGHGTYAQALDFAKRANIKEAFYPFHYNVIHDDYKIKTIRDLLPEDLPFIIVFPQEGKEIRV